MQYDRFIQCDLNGQHGIDGYCRAALQSSTHGLPACICKVHDCSTVAELNSNVTLPLTPKRTTLSFALLPTPQFFKVQNTNIYEVISYQSHHLRVQDCFILFFAFFFKTLRLILAHFWALWPSVLYLLYLLWLFSVPFFFLVPDAFLFWNYLW